MKVLLGSGGFRTPERIALLREQMRPHFGQVPRLLFIPYALRDHNAYVQSMTERGLNGDYVLDGLHQHPDPLRAVREAEGIYVGGGNTFRLLHTLYQLGLLDAIRERVKNDGVPYLGISAGANLACPTIKTTNDMPIVQPPSFDALGLVPFQINPHYYTGSNYVLVGETFHQHFGETRDDRIREFHEMNETPVVGLWEGAMLRLEADQVKVIGSAARLFQKGRDPEDLATGVYSVTQLA